MKEHLTSWGLEAKNPQTLGSQEGAGDFGLSIDKDLKWSRHCDFSVVPTEPLTKREVHAFCGHWLRYYPVAIWLCAEDDCCLKIACDDKVDDLIMNRRECLSVIDVFSRFTV